MPFNDQPTVKSGDVEIPLLGFGTWQLEPDDARRMVAAALQIGYRHIDTAWLYRNEEAVGEGIRDSGLAREDIFLTTKIWVANFADGDLQRQAEESAKNLGFTPDLLLLHWPKATPSIEDAVASLNDAKDRGLTRAIGVSNYPSKEFRRAAQASRAPIVTNQVEYHPYLSLHSLIATANELGSTLTAWSPLAQGKTADDPTIREIAEAHDKTPAQVTLRWVIQQGVIAIPRTAKESRARENFGVFDFELTGEDMDRLHALATPNGRLGDWIDPDFQWDRE